MEDGGIAASNEALAGGYDAVPYAPARLTALSVSGLKKVAALFGCGGAIQDVLDLGCGHGAQLGLAAEETRGRLVGVDLSQTACAAAREALKAHGDRVEIACEDLLGLTPERLGSFDLIYCLGVISFVPLEVRHKLLQLIGECLRPSGVAVISYYAGARHLVRASIGRTLLAAIDNDAPPQARIGQARAVLAQIKAELEAAGVPAGGLLHGAVQHGLERDDVMFFHEMLNAESESLETSQLEQRLAREGVGFLGFDAPANFMARPTSRHRALAVDVALLVNSGYVYAVFGKGDGALGKADPRAPGFAWTTDLRRPGGVGADVYRETAAYEEPALGLTVRVDNPVAQAFVDAIAAAPLGWEAALAAARGRLVEATGAPGAASDDEVAAAVAQLWALRGIRPVPV